MDLEQSVLDALPEDEEGTRQRELWEAVSAAFTERGLEGVTQEITRLWEAKAGDLSELIEEIRGSL